MRMEKNCIMGSFITFFAKYNDQVMEDEMDRA
jgi:hypothetical protein